MVSSLLDMYEWCYSISITLVRQIYSYDYFSLIADILLEDTLLGNNVYLG